MIPPQKDGLLYCEQERGSAKLVEQSLSGLIFSLIGFFTTSALKFMSVKRLKTFYLNIILICLTAKRKEYQKQREAEMTKNDWQRWFRLKDDARKLIEGLSLLKNRIR